MKDENGKTVLRCFIEIGKESKSKQNKICFDQGKKKKKNFIQKWFYYENNLMCSTHKKVGQ